MKYAVTHYSIIHFTNYVTAMQLLRIAYMYFRLIHINKYLVLSSAKSYAS